MAHPQHAPRRLAHRGKGFGQDVVERLAGGEPFAEFRRLRLQRGIVERLHLRLEGVDLVDDLAERGDVAVVGRAEKAFGNAAEHGDFPWISMLERRSEEHTSELQSLMRISYAVFC